jgi:hypothetical protein
MAAAAAAAGSGWLLPARGTGARVCRQGPADGVDGGDAAGGGGVQVGAVAAPAGEGRLGVPVPGDGLVPLGGLGALLADVVRPLDGGFAGEQAARDCKLPGPRRSDLRVPRLDNRPQPRDQRTLITLGTTRQRLAESRVNRESRPRWHAPC